MLLLVIERKLQAPFTEFLEGSVLRIEKEEKRS